MDIGTDIPQKVRKWLAWGTEVDCITAKLVRDTLTAEQRERLQYRKKRLKMFIAAQQPE